MNDDLKFLVGLGAGAAVGYAIGILLAPEDGRQIRGRILKEADNLAQKLIDDGLNEINNNSPKELKS